MIIRRSPRTLVVAATIFFALVVLFFIPQTGIKDKSTSYVNSLLSSSKDANATKEEPTWAEGKWFFELPLDDYQLPKFDKAALAAAPQHYKGPGYNTIATFYASRSTDMHDPYFIAAQQIVYRVLWHPRTKTDKLTMTVFVAPFVSQEQREYFLAAGAIVRELPLRPFVPDHPGTAGRLKDMFTKLEMWYQFREFDRIAYLDSDAFPMDHIDSIFDLVPWQECKKELLPETDLSVADDICRYSFGGWRDFNGINAGVLVFNPNEAMYGRLVRESLDQSKFDNGFMEQALLALAYDEHGPFPPSELNHSWNAGPDLTRDTGHQFIVHHKLWANGFEPHDSWHYNEFKHIWQDMLDFYKTPWFLSERKASGSKTYWE